MGVAVITLVPRSGRRTDGAIASGFHLPSDDEQLLLRILGLTLIVAALAEQLHASAAVGAPSWWG